MNIVVLDGTITNPGDLSWDSLSSLGNLTVHPMTVPGQIVDRCADADIVCTNKVPLDKDTIAALARLKMIDVLATGFNVVDISAAQEHGITVCNVPNYCSEVVAERVFALLFSLTHAVCEHDAAVKSGAWSRSKGFCLTLRPLLECFGLTMGIIGYGNIGKRVEEIARALRMDILILDHKNSGQSDRRFVAMKTLLGNSDIITLHCPLNEMTRNLIGKDAIALMKSSAFLINTARGVLVDNQALANALNEGRIAGAGLDVLDQEPPESNHPLIRAKNCIITPHNAWASVAARRRLLDVAADNVRAYLAGKPINKLRAPLKIYCATNLLRCAVLAISPIYMICLDFCAPCALQLGRS